MRHVVLVAVRVEHHDDALESRQDVEEMAADELRVLQSDLRRQERLGNAARGGHREETEVTREVRGERQAVAGELRLDEEPRRQQRLDPIRAAARRVRCDDHRST